MNQTFSNVRLGFSAAALSLVIACGGEKEDLTGPCTSATKTEEPKTEKKEEASAGAQGGWSTALTDADYVTYGKQIFLDK